MVQVQVLTQVAPPESLIHHPHALVIAKRKTSEPHTQPRGPPPPSHSGQGRVAQERESRTLRRRDAEQRRSCHDRQAHEREMRIKAIEFRDNRDFGRLRTRDQKRKKAKGAKAQG